MYFSTPPDGDGDDDGDDGLNCNKGQGTFCAESGSFFLNYKGYCCVIFFLIFAWLLWFSCAKCGKKEILNSQPAKEGASLIGTDSCESS